METTNITAKYFAPKILFLIFYCSILTVSLHVQTILGLVLNSAYLVLQFSKVFFGDWKLVWLFFQIQFLLIVNKEVFIIRLLLGYKLSVSWDTLEHYSFLYTHLGYSLNFTVVCLCHVMGKPPPGRGKVGKNRSTWSKPTVSIVSSIHRVLLYSK